MSTLLHWFTSPEWAQVVKALLHSLWQGAAIALLLAILLRRLTSPVARYRASLAALAVIIFATIITWSVVNASAHCPAPAPLEAQITIQSAPKPITTSEPDSKTQTVVLPGREAPTIHWTAWLAFAWLAGAMLMLARAGIKVTGAEQLRRSCRPLDDPRIESLLAETRRALGLARRIRVGVTDKLTSPAVVGVVVPMLILPLALLTTLTPEQIRFVLLHELAHIRRRDYLANLFQFFAESLLFFNPAVWWISHQIRREREACCDALATELSGAPADYAQTLVHVAEQILYPAPAAAPAFGDKRQPSSLAERIQRLLVPGYRPSLRLTWRAMLAALVFGSILLFLSAIGTRFTVAAILTPQQRIDAIEKKMIEYGQKPEGSAQASQGPLTITAHVRTADGSPLPRKRLGTIYEQSGNASSVGSVDIKKDGTISYKTASPGEIWVAAYVDGFAPAIAGPFDASDTNRLDAGELVLDRGFDVTIRLTDADSGKALSNAALHTQFWMRGIGCTVQEPGDLKTDSNGEATLHRCADQPLTIGANAAGHEITDQRFENLHSGEILDLKLRPGRQIAGIVTDKATGQPIAGATVRIIYQKGPTTSHYEWNDPIRILATTGDDGRFAANQLQPATIYWLGVSAPEHESIILSNLLAGEQNANARLGPELIVRGQVVGDVKGETWVNDHYALYRNWTDVFDGNGWGNGEWVPLEDVNGVMRFEFTNRTPGTAQLADHKGRTFEQRVDAPVDNWVIDLNEVQKTAAAVSNAPKRELIFRLIDKSGVPPRGTVSVDVPDNLDPKHLTAHFEILQITNGEVRVQIPIGGRTSIEPKAMIGYWFSQFENNNTFMVEVTNGPGPMVLEVPVIPAGAIYAKALNADGTPAGGLLFGVQELKRAPGRDDNTPLNSNSDSLSDSAPRKWVSGPLPLGGTYCISGWRGNSFCVSKPITLTGENPTAEVELQFPPGKTFEGVLLDAARRPVANTSLTPSFTLLQSGGFQLNAVFTDEDGHFRMENLTPGVGDYTIEANVPGMTAERVKLDFNRQPQTIRLERGRRIAGTLVEANTTNIIPGAEVRAVILENYKLPALTTHTDADGHFEFTEAGSGDYKFFLDCGVPASQQTYRGNVDTNITLAVKLYSWSKVKPQPKPAAAEQANAGDALPNPYINPQHQRIHRKLTTITLDKVSYPGMPLSEVTRSLLLDIQRHDPDHQQFVFVLGNASATNDTLTNWMNLKDVRINLNQELRHVRLEDVLSNIVNSAERPIKYTLVDDGIAFSFRDTIVPEMFTRTFKIDPNAVLTHLGCQIPADTNETSLQAVRADFYKAYTNAGFNLQPPKAAFFNYKKGTVTVRATLQDLQAVETWLDRLNDTHEGNSLPNKSLSNPVTQSPAQNASPADIAAAVQDGKLLFQRGKLDEAKAKLQQALQSDPDNQAALYYLSVIKKTRVAGSLQTSPPEVVIKARFVEVNQGSNWLQKFNLYPKTAATNNQPTTTAILTAPALKDVLNALERRDGANLLNEGEVTTLSGRQAQFRIIDDVPPPHPPLVVFVPTNSVHNADSGIVFDGTNIVATNTRGRPVQIVYDTNSIPIAGVTLDVHPDITADQAAVRLALIASFTDFAGYDLGPERDGVRHMTPKYHATMFTNNCTLWTGQTAVFGGLVGETTQQMKDKVPILGDLPFLGHLFRSQSSQTHQKNVLVFVTATIIDPAGNPIQAQDDQDLSKTVDVSARNP